MALTRYYRRFLVGYSNIAHAITSLQRKNTRFEWTHKCEGNFKLIKRTLINVQVLKIAYLEKDFVVCTDAKDTCIGGVLMQKSYVISYVS